METILLQNIKSDHFLSDMQKLKDVKFIQKVNSKLYNFIAQDTKIAPKISFNYSKISFF